MSNSAPVGTDSFTGGRRTAPARPWWLGVLVIVLGAVWLYGAASLPQTAQYARIGPGLSVTLIGVGLLLLGLLLLVQIGRGEQFSAQGAEDAIPDAPADWRAFFTAVAAVALPLATMRHLGFPVTAALSFALVARAFGSRRLFVDLAIGAALSLVAYFAFARLGVTLGGLLPIIIDR